MNAPLPTIGALAPSFQQLGQVRLLVVDDDEVDRLAVRRAFAQSGMEVLLSEARAADEAVAMARIGRFECILLDYNLPGHDGLYVLRQLQQTVRAPVVILTGQDDPEVAAQLIKQGAVDYLPKNGLTPRRLAETVRHTVELHRARENEEQTRAALHVSEELIRGIMDCSEDCVKVLDRDGAILTMSAGGLRLLEIDDLSEVVGRLWPSFWSDEERPAAEKALAAACAGTIGRFEGLAPSGSGRPIWWEVVLTPIRNQAGEVHRVLAISRDVTERRRREEFEQQLIGIVSHDLRNPLNAIMLANETLRRRGGLEPHQLQLVDRVRRSAERAGRMVRDLLDFTHARLAGGLPIQTRETDLVELVRQCADELAQAHPGRSLRVEAPADSRGQWDPDRLSQVISNLASNAIQYSPPGSEIRMTVGGGSQAAELCVHNHGDPIPVERLGEIFEPLERAGRLDSGARSIGLGLYIVKQVVTAHGGEVTVTSSEAEGTTFRVRLPREPNTVPEVTLPDAGPPSPTLLLIEDDDDIRLAERDVLEAEGFRVVEARDGAEGLRALARVEGPCVVIVDLMMPVMDGLEFLRRISADPELERRLRVIVTSADLHLRAKVEDLGVRTVLQKPFDLDSLFQLVRTQSSALMGAEAAPATDGRPEPRSAGSGAAR